jgi:hypothetical protein
MKKLIEQEGGPAAFSRKTKIPLRTVESWASDAESSRNPPAWLVPILNDWLKMKRRDKE